MGRVSAKWRSEWDSTRSRLKMGDVPPAIALDWVKGERERIAIESDRSKLLARVEGIDADAKRFAERLKQWESAGPVRVVELASRLSIARQAKARLQEIEEQSRLSESEEASCREELSRVASRWQALLHEAGTDDESLLPSLMDESDRRGVWEDKRSLVEQQLAPLAHELRGESLDDLVGSWNLDDLGREEQEIARTIDETQGEISRLDQTLGLLRGEQARIDGNGEGLGWPSKCKASWRRSSAMSISTFVSRWRVSYWTKRLSSTGARTKGRCFAGRVRLSGN